MILQVASVLPVSLFYWLVCLVFFLGCTEDEASLQSQQVLNQSLTKCFHLLLSFQSCKGKAIPLQAWTEAPRFIILLQNMECSCHKTMKYNQSCVTIRITNRCDFCTMSLFPFSRLFPTCFGPSWAHHQGYFKLLFSCYHLVHAVLC